MEALAADRQVVRYDPKAFKDWHADLMDKAGQNVDKMAAKHLWERGFSIYDALVKITRP